MTIDCRKVTKKIAPGHNTRKIIPPFLLRQVKCIPRSCSSIGQSTALSRRGLRVRAPSTPVGFFLLEADKMGLHGRKSQKTQVAAKCAKKRQNADYLPSIRQADPPCCSPSSIPYSRLPKGSYTHSIPRRGCFWAISRTPSGTSQGDHFGETPSVSALLHFLWLRGIPPWPLQTEKFGLLAVWSG